MAPRESRESRESPQTPRDRQRRHRHGESRHGESAARAQHRKRRSQGRRSATTSEDTREERGTSQSLSSDALAKLNRHNAKQKRYPERRRSSYRSSYRPVAQEFDQEQVRPRRKPKHRKRRVVSGAMMEEGRARGHGRGWSDETFEKQDYTPKSPKKWTKRKRIWLLGGASLVLLIIIIVVAVVVSQKKKGAGNSSGDTRNLDDTNRDEVPAKYRNTYLDPWSWQSTTDFNVTFTDQMVGDLPVIGLYSDWDDSNKANDKVPALNEEWGSYATRPARGVNLGGWLSLEPFIKPSLFDYDVTEGIIDEWTLSQHLGSKAQETLEKHYATFVTEDTFKAIQAAGLDHIRIPFSYWAVEVYDGDPYVFRTSWRYLLRGIEWARKYGLRVNLDLHGLPGSQNGWNHSGRWGYLQWLNGTDGELNGKRSLEIHDRLSKFFGQERYKNIITHYGLANEPRMTYLKVDDVLAWTQSAYKTVRANGVNALVVFGDGFMGLGNWQGKLAGHDDMVLDVHQYVIFNKNQIDFTHQEKVNYACDGWTKQAEQSMDTSTGYGPTIFAEWSQADTDCAKFLTNVGQGDRWEGTYDSTDQGSAVTSPGCPTKDGKCSCANANADPSDWSDEYKQFLQMFAEAQMHSFEKGWGWWYWTWKTESSPQWSYEGGLAAGILPKKAYERGFNCDTDVPDFSTKGLPEYY